jgi:hypothetical protein
LPYEPGLVCEHDDLDAVAEAEFLEDVRDVGPDGRLADVELGAALCVGQAAGDGITRPNWLRSSSVQ